MDKKPQNTVDAEAVTWAYRMILGREPESQVAIQTHLKGHPTLESLRQSFLSSAEFRLNLDRAPGFYDLRESVKRITGLDDAEILEIDMPGQEKRQIHSAFYRGENCNFWPYMKDYANGDFIEQFLLKGWMPESRVINSETRITAFGSCFAEGIANYLSRLGYDLSRNRDPEIYISRMGEGLVNTYAILQQFEWALENQAPPDALWHGFNAEEFGYGDEIRKRTRSAFLGTDFFIITLGLSEIWFDQETGGVFWRAVPMKNFDPARHKFRVCSFEETKRNISDIYNIIRKHIPEARVLFTLSPIPLAATFRPVGCLTANSVSKAILRSSLDEFYREHSGDLNKSLFYFPSYEIVNELFLNKFEEIDCRHPGIPVIEFIMQTFEAVYCRSGMALAEVNKLFRNKRVANKRSIDTTRP